MNNTRRLSTDTAAYVNARYHWANVAKQDLEQYRRCFHNPGSDYGEDVVQPFHVWLATQHCRIVDGREAGRSYGVDSYNVAVGTDYLEFDTAQDLSFFVLRWT